MAKIICGELLYADEGPSKEHPYGLMVCTEESGTEHDHDNCNTRPLHCGDVFWFDKEKDIGRVL